jgi:hypothetical protein
MWFWARNDATVPQEVKVNNMGQVVWIVES